nr:unnamed protein product [Callosobruchus chinensis]
MALKKMLPFVALGITNLHAYKDHHVYLIRNSAEACTLKAAAINRIEAFEMWTLRRMLKISWTEHVRNDDDLRMDGLEDREHFERIKKRNTSYLGHIIRRERCEFQRLILQGKIEDGRRGIGRKKLSWLRDIHQWTGISDFQSIQEAARNRII